MQQRPSIFQRLLYTVTGLGQEERHSAINALLTGLRKPNLAVIKPLSASQTQRHLEEIHSTHVGNVSYSMPVSQLWAVGSDKFQTFLEDERLKRSIIEDLPSRRGVRTNSIRALGLARVDEYLFELSNAWTAFQNCHAFCTSFPTLPDPDRVRVMHSFAKLALDRNWPGAAEFSGITALAAQHVIECLPVDGTPHPENYGKKVLRGRPRYQPALDWVLKDPDGAVGRYLEPMVPETDTRIRKASDFGDIARKCIEHKKVDVARPSFAEQIEALSKSIVRDRLSEIPTDERSKLNRFSNLMELKTASIIAAHKDDVSLVENLDIADEESITAAVNAMVRIEQRCPFEFSRLGVGFADQYVRFATAENPSKPIPIQMQPLTIEELRNLLPEVPEQQPSIPLRDYVRQVQKDMKANFYAELKFPLVKGSDRTRYLIPLSHDNSYRQMARDLKARAEYRPSGFNATEFYEGDSGANRRQFMRFVVDRWIDERVSAFEELRLALLKDIQKMLDEPKFITDKRFHDTAAMMEQMRETSPEDYLHFANAFLHAWEQIPTMILEKVMPHGDVGFVIDGSSERAKKALKREMEMSRGPSLSR